MRRRGLFYMKGSSRMFLPADLADEDMSTRLSLLVQKRFNIGLTYADTASRTLNLTAFHITDTDTASLTVSAHFTHNGYYVARLPIPEKSRAIALAIGEAMAWVEIAGVTQSRVASLKGALQDEAARPCSDVRYDDMREHAPGLFECQSDNALIFIRPRGGANVAARDPQMIEVVLRPLTPKRAPAKMSPDNQADSRASGASFQKAQFQS